MSWHLSTRALCKRAFPDWRWSLTVWCDESRARISQNIEIVVKRINRKNYTAQMIEGGDPRAVVAEAQATRASVAVTKLIAAAGESLALKLGR